MKDRSYEGLERERSIIMDDAKKLTGFSDVEEIPSLFKPVDVARCKPLYLLGQSIQLLAAADAAIFAPGWEEARGCRIEHECAVQYGIRIIDLSNGQYEHEIS